MKKYKMHSPKRVTLAKSSRKMQKFSSLDYSDDNEIIFIGLCTSFKDFKLSYLLNSIADTRFRRYGSVKGDSGKMFTKFVWEDTEFDILWTLISNKQESSSLCPWGQIFSNNSMATRSYFLPQEKRFDYFIKVEGRTPVAYKVREVIQNINVSGIASAFVVKRKTYFKKMIELNIY